MCCDNGLLFRIEFIGHLQEWFFGCIKRLGKIMYSPLLLSQFIVLRDWIGWNLRMFIVFSCEFKGVICKRWIQSTYLAFKTIWYCRCSFLFPLLYPSKAARRWEWNWGCECAVSYLIWCSCSGSFRCCIIWWLLRLSLENVTLFIGMIAAIVPPRRLNVFFSILWRKHTIKVGK